MNDLTQLSYKIMFLGLLLALLTLSVPAPAQETGSASPVPFEDRGAVAPLPVPDSATDAEKAVDEAPAAEVRSNITGPGMEEVVKDAQSQDTAPQSPTIIGSPIPSGSPESEDFDVKIEKKPWWKFW